MPDYGTTLKNTLDNLEQILLGRSKVHGDYEETFKLISEYWTLYLRGIGLIGYEDELSQNDSAHMLTLFKIARASVNPDNEENSDDAAGYQVLASAMIRGAKQQATTPKSHKIEVGYMSEAWHKKVYGELFELAHTEDHSDDEYYYQLYDAGDEFESVVKHPIRWRGVHNEAFILFKNTKYSSTLTDQFGTPLHFHVFRVTASTVINEVWNEIVRKFKDKAENENVV